MYIVVYIQDNGPMKVCVDVEGGRLYTWEDPSDAVAFFHEYMDNVLIFNTLSYRVVDLKRAWNECSLT